MVERYFFHNEDVTLDILMKTESIVHLLAQREERPFDDCLIAFTASNTYRTLQNTESQLWAESAEFIVDEYYRELRDKKCAGR